MRIRTSAVALPILLAACTPAIDDSPEALAEATSARSPLDGTPEGVGVLAFVNDGTTTVTVLDNDVPLDVRAAKGIVHHRDGADRVYGTRDDDRFDGIEELDNVSYVGPAALDALFAYAAADGWVPSGAETLGTYDGVSFTVDEADATVAFVNAATYDQLDVEVGLDKRAVDAIVAARPLPSVLALSELYYVGGSALTDLKDAAAEPPSEDAAALCASEGIGAIVDGAHYLLLPDAIAAAGAGDTITLCDGTFGDPVIVEKDLTIRSLNGASATWLDVTAMGSSAVYVNGASLTLEGITVTYGEGTEDAATGKRFGGGLYVAGAGDVAVKGCVFMENYAHDGAAVWHGGTGTLTLTDTRIDGNYGSRDGGGLWTSAPVVISGGSIVNNAAVKGGGIRVASGGTVTATSVLVSDNAPDDVYTASGETIGGAASFTCTAASCAF
jgi:hypothetical protein